jgi:hypothetical protein
MVWSTLSDLANKAVRTGFGRSVTYTSMLGVVTSLTAVFDSAYQVVELHGEVPVSGTQPVLTVRLADLPTAPLAGDQVQVGTAVYKVADVRLDGEGGAKLFLLR